MSYFFFFQAEDGIRDYKVTGVQTCALPILFGRYAGFTALLPTMAGAADRCVIPEHPADVERLAELLTQDRNKNPSRYAVVLVSEGARLATHDGMTYEGEETDMFGHRKLGGIGEQVGVALRDA